MSNQTPSFQSNRVLRALVAGVIFVGIAVLVVWGFVEGRSEAALEAERERPVAAPLRVSTANGAPIIKLDADTQRRSAIETSRLTATPYQEQVRAYGVVLDLARLTELSNNYANARAQLQMAQAKLAASQTAFERAQKLYNGQQIVSLAQLQAAEAISRTDQAAVTSAESQLHTLAATVHQEWGPVLAKALIEGAPLITRLIERHDFLLQVTLPPGVTLPAPPQSAAIESGKDVRAAISFVSPATRTDPKIQGVSFLYTMPADNRVMPGMNVLAFLPAGATIDGAAVPASAIVWWQDRAWIYRREGADTFARLKISTDHPASGGGYIVKDLPKDAEIVTQGAQMLLSEEFRAQIQVGGD